MEEQGFALSVENLRCVPMEEAAAGGACEIGMSGLRVREDEFLSIVGRNGVGKSTLLRVLAGERVRVSRTFSVEVDGLRWFDADEYSAVNDRIAFLRQRPPLIPWLSVRRNLEYAKRLRERRNPGCWTVDELVELMELEKLCDRYPGGLSGGEYQRAALAQVLCVEPDLLLLDEPASAADPAKRRATLEVLSILRDRRTQRMDRPFAVIQVTHDVENALAVSSAMLVMVSTDGGSRAFQHRFSVAMSGHGGQVGRIEAARLRQSVAVLCSATNVRALTPSEARSREGRAKPGDTVVIVALEARRELDLVRDAEFLATVCGNLARGVRYRYFFPDSRDVEELRQRLRFHVRSVELLAIHENLGYDLFDDVGDVVLVLRGESAIDGWWFPLSYNYTLIQPLTADELSAVYERILRTGLGIDDASAF